MPGRQGGHPRNQKNGTKTVKMQEKARTCGGQGSVAEIYMLALLPRSAGFSNATEEQVWNVRNAQ